MITGCIFSVVGIILCFVGTIFDGVTYGVTNDLKTCINQDTLAVFGESKYYPNAAGCIPDHAQTCLCVNGDNNNCYLFDLNHGNENCGMVLTKLPSLLLASMFFCLILLALVGTYSACTCMTICCGPKDNSANQNLTANAHQVSGSSSPTANPVMTTAAVMAYPAPGIPAVEGKKYPSQPGV